MEINRSDIRLLPRPSFLDDLIVEEEVSVPGIETKCFLLDWKQGDDALDAWALHIRRHYIRDDELASFAAFTGLSKEEYLTRTVVPTMPRILGGDFGEIVVSDLVQFVEGYSVPRYKQHDRKDRNASEHGTDVLAYKIGDVAKPSPNDTVLLVEVKSAANSSLKDALEAAGEDCGKDPSRVAMTMDYYLRDCLRSGDMQTAYELKRLLDKGEHSYKTVLACASTAKIGDVSKHLGDRTAKDLGIDGYERVYIIHKTKLMDLVHDLFGRCVR